MNGKQREAASRYFHRRVIEGVFIRGLEWKEDQFLNDYKVLVHVQKTVQMDRWGVYYGLYEGLSRLRTSILRLLSRFFDFRGEVEIVPQYRYRKEKREYHTMHRHNQLARLGKGRR